MCVVFVVAVAASVAVAVAVTVIFVAVIVGGCSRTVGRPAAAVDVLGTMIAVAVDDCGLQHQSFLLRIECCVCRGYGGMMLESMQTF